MLSTWGITAVSGQDVSGRCLPASSTLGQMLALHSSIRLDFVPEVIAIRDRAYLLFDGNVDTRSHRQYKGLLPR